MKVMTLKVGSKSNNRPKLVMRDANWEKVREIFDSALRRLPEGRQSFVNKACGVDKSLRVEVDFTLSSHDGAESFMETPDRQSCRCY